MTTTISGSTGVTYPAGGVDNVAGAGVGTTDTQTLTNKTLTSPTITSPTISGAVVSSMASSVITSGTSQASTSGTSIDFTGIPSWAKRITVLFNGVSTNGTSAYIVQIGSGSFTTSGYVGSASDVGGVTAFTTGFGCTKVSSASLTYYGQCVISLFSANNYVSSSVVAPNTTNSTTVGGGSLALGATLDRVRITTVGGTDTFDAGSINILYE